MGPTHRTFGALCGAAAGSVAPVGHSVPTLVVMGLTGAIATVSAGGTRFSPDLDQGKLWRTISKHVPGASHIMGHRGITHWWGWPLGWAAMLLWLPVPFAWKLVPFALVVGWTSHLIGDLLFGGYLPVWPWSSSEKFWNPIHVKANGWVEKYLANGVIVALGGLLVWSVVA